MLVNGTIRYEVEIVKESIETTDPAPARKLPPGARKNKPPPVPTFGYVFRYVKCAPTALTLAGTHAVRAMLHVRTSCVHTRSCSVMSGLAVRPRACVRPLTPVGACRADGRAVRTSGRRSRTSSPTPPPSPRLRRTDRRAKTCGVTARPQATWGWVGRRRRVRARARWTSIRVRRHPRVPCLSPPPGPASSLALACFPPRPRLPPSTAASTVPPSAATSTVPSRGEQARAP